MLCKFRLGKHSSRADITEKELKSWVELRTLLMSVACLLRVAACMLHRQCS